MHKDFTIPYSIARSKRKTVAISLSPLGEVSVKAPLGMSQKDIDDFIRRHRRWIEKHQARLLEKAENRVAFTWSDGELVPILGQWYPLRRTAYTAFPALVDNHMELGPTKSELNSMASFYKGLGEGYLGERVAYFAPLLGVSPSGLRITSARTRWGSCGPRDNLCFSWRLLCLPAEAVDAVVVHELAHLVERNHSRRFYDVIHRVMPDYKDRHKLLKAFADTIPF